MTLILFTELVFLEIKVDGQYLTYIALSEARPNDDNWHKKVLKHRKRRPNHWKLIETTDLLNAVDSSLSLYPSDAIEAALGSLPMQSARIVYATDSPATSYSDSYEAAENSLYTAIANTRSLGTEDSVKSDGQVTFRELICVAEN